MSKKWTGTWCPQCGSNIRVDKDGCCNSCGCVAVGNGCEEALGALATARDTSAFDAIAEAAGCPQWDYPGQLVRDVEMLAERVAHLTPPPGAQEMATALMAWTTATAMMAWTTDDVDRPLTPAADRLGRSITGPVVDWLARIARGTHASR